MSTEAIDPRFAEIDRWPTETAVSAMLEEQIAALGALREQAAAIAAAAEAAAVRLRGERGRLAYAGAGTSARVGVQDGVELTPTYGWPEARLRFLIAGGAPALTGAVEGAEDDGAAARAAVAEAGLGPADVLIGIAASGRTPYAVAAVEAARAAGALTIALANNPATPLLTAAEHAILAETGAEAIAGSTRMGAGTAQKVALNLLSTAIMLRCGRVYRGRMVHMRVSNAKLLARGIAMVADLAGVPENAAATALDAAGRDIRQAVLLARGLAAPEAAALLDRHHGDLGAALRALS